MIVEINFDGLIGPSHNYAGLSPGNLVATSNAGKIAAPRRAAMRMLENEGFACENYVDIFDGGPTMTARTDTVRTIRDVRPARVYIVDEDGGAQSLVATGRLAEFRCAYGRVRDCVSGIAIDKACASALAVGEGDDVSHVGRL